MKILKFEAPLMLMEKGGAYVEIPFDVEKEFGSKRPKIKALINKIEYRGLLVKMKTPCHILGVLKEIREKLNIQENDLLQIEVQLDTEERIIEIPPDFLEHLIDENLQNYFQHLAYTHRKEYIRWIEEAKKSETREKRLKKAIEMLNNKQMLS